MAHLIWTASFHLLSAAHVIKILHYMFIAHYNNIGKSEEYRWGHNFVVIHPSTENNT